jgi:hypothetical protein
MGLFDDFISLARSVAGQAYGLVARIPAAPQTMQQLQAALEALPEDQRKELLTKLRDASSDYEGLGRFIKGMNPYGDTIIYFPSLAMNDTGERADLIKLRRDKGIEVAGWLQTHHEGRPMESSDFDMTLAEKHQCFYWDFRFPDMLAANEFDGRAPSDNVGDPKGGQLHNLQIAKAIRIPFLFQQTGNPAVNPGATPEQLARRRGRLLVGHLVIGYEGAGGA